MMNKEERQKYREEKAAELSKKKNKNEAEKIFVAKYGVIKKDKSKK